VTLTIRPKFPAQLDYAGTFFADLEVSVVTPEEFQIFALSVSPDGVKPDQPERLTPTAWVHKTFWYSDRRYNPAQKSWKLDDLIKELELAASFGPVEPKNVEQHSAFEIERPQLEDEVVRVTAGGVALNGWAIQPLYPLGRFEILPPAIETLKQVQDYVRSGKV
jgi:hypothetical protein